VPVLLLTVFAAGSSPPSAPLPDDFAPQGLELERANRELRRANDVLEAASAFFARELCASTQCSTCSGRTSGHNGVMVASLGRVSQANRSAFLFSPGHE
jgi:hypothetical protein